MSRVNWFTLLFSYGLRMMNFNITTSYIGFIEFIKIKTASLAFCAMDFNCLSSVLPTSFIRYMLMNFFATFFIRNKIVNIPMCSFFGLQRILRNKVFFIEYELEPTGFIVVDFRVN